MFHPLEVYIEHVQAGIVSNEQIPQNTTQSLFYFSCHAPRELSFSVPCFAGEHHGLRSCFLCALSEDTAEDGERPPGSSSRPGLNLADRDLTDSRKADGKSTHRHAYCTHTYRTHMNRKLPPFLPKLSFISVSLSLR